MGMGTFSLRCETLGSDASEESLGHKVVEA